MSKSTRSDNIAPTNDFIKNAWTRYHPNFESDDLNPPLAVSPWAGHRLFSYDLIAFFRPAKIVELGSHYGCSFFAFLQAAKDLKLDIECIAIDTWEGEAHSGLYTDEVYDLFCKTINSSYSNQNVHLLRKTFDLALEDVEDSSVNLLHIDGFHSYEAVKHDFETWINKLSTDGIVLFHDIAPSSGYGSANYWNEIKCNYDHIEFLDHSFGLGVLFPKGNKVYQEIKRTGCLDWIEIYRFQAEYNLKKLQYADAKELLEKRWESMQSMDELIRGRDEANSAQAEMLEERWSIMQSMDEKIQQRDQIIGNISKDLAQSEEVISNQKHMIEDCNSNIKSITQEIQRKNELINKYQMQFNRPAIKFLSHLGFVKLV